LQITEQQLQRKEKKSENGPMKEMNEQVKDKEKK
jgi:hypothetical protein